MIPLKLHIKNFLSYSAPQDIDFEPYPLICLSGKNGHGKSSLLDALTWALWGQARKASGMVKADEGLVHLGETHMMVILDFMCNGIHYRVKREFTLSAKKGQANLEFGILEKETNSFKPLTDKTIRGTQSTIIRTIGLEYEGFINSAFIKQGQSQEFSKKSPKERKDLLASLLGLEHYEQIRKLAQDKVKESQTAQEQTQNMLKSLEEELKEKRAVQEQLIQSKETLQQLLDKEKVLHLEYENHTRLVAQAQLQKLELEKILFKHDHLAQKIEDELTIIRSNVKTWREVQKKQKHEPSSLLLEQERELLQKELHTFQLMGAKKLKLREELLLKREALRSHLQQITDTHAKELETLDREIHRVAHELKTAQHTCLELAKKSSHKTKELDLLTAQLIDLKKNIQPLNEALIATLEKQLERGKSYYHSFISRAQSLKSSLEGILQKKVLITASEQAVCPLCEQNADKDHLINKLMREESLHTHQRNRLNRVCSSLKNHLTQEHSRLEALKKNREYQQVLQAQLTELEKQSQKEQSEVELIKQELQTFDSLSNTFTIQAQELALKRSTLIKNFNKISSEDTISFTLKTDADRLENELAQVPYDDEKEKALAIKLSVLAEKSKHQSSFLRELTLQDERKRSIHERSSYTRNLKKELLQLKQAMPVAPHNEYPPAKEKLLKESLEGVTREKELYFHQKGSLENHMRVFDQKEQAVEQLTKNAQEFAQRAEEYNAVASAFSKDGIQALLIEEALPEIEEEANLLLSRLTENQAHISIDSLRDTKSGKTKETLDIKISDAVGVRPYEMFSGGEAFRIDFALRIALSKLLARRAGTALQTLIIDEGFGSQDEEGLGYIMQAIHMIREDFEKVIIISHLPALKEQFPVHFEVQKTPEGSMVSVVEHC
jgi:exonuclease SbcC